MIKKIFLGMLPIVVTLIGVGYVVDEAESLESHPLYVLTDKEDRGLDKLYSGRNKVISSDNSIYINGVNSENKKFTKGETVEKVADKEYSVLEYDKVGKKRDNSITVFLDKKSEYSVNFRHTDYKFADDTLKVFNLSEVALTGDFTKYKNNGFSTFKDDYFFNRKAKIQLSVDEKGCLLIKTENLKELKEEFKDFKFSAERGIK